MADWAYRLGDLVGVTTDGHPTQISYCAMAVLLVGRFLQVTSRERARQVHMGLQCHHHYCGICQDIALRHAQWATDKLHKHVNDGPPCSRGLKIRDWETIIEWTTSSDKQETNLITVREALSRRLCPDDPILPLVLALSTQLLPLSRDARAPRRMRDYVGDPRKSVVAQQQDWAVKPDRDLRTRKDFAAVRQRHERGVELLLDILKYLDYGDAEPYRTVLDGPKSRPGDQAVLRALIEEMLEDQAMREWFMRNVDARHSYNQDRMRRSRRYAAEVESLTDGAERLHYTEPHSPHPQPQPGKRSTRRRGGGVEIDAGWDGIR